MKRLKRPQFFFRCIWLLSLAVSYSLVAAQESADTQSIYDLAEQENALLLAIADIESQNGPYDPQLVELLESAGRLALENENFEQAAQLFERALNVSRISAGLQSAEQLRVLPPLVESLSGAGDWEAADDRMQLRMHLQRRLLDVESEEFARAVVDFTQWKLDAIDNPEISLRELAELSELQQLQDLILESLLPEEGRHSYRSAIDALYGASYSDSTKADLLHQLALSRVQEIESRIKAVNSQTLFTEPQYVYRTVCQNQATADGELVRVCYEQPVENPRFLEQQNIIRNATHVIERAERQYAYTLDALRELQTVAPETQMSDGSAIADTITELLELEQELKRSLRSSRF
ncbi:MAG: hypothetical protein R3332_09315 [Pseudohongiellaceae bacterium]|nr:hypothetical protein [Pseudohongiellaceae bacterium]